MVVVGFSPSYEGSKKARLQDTYLAPKKNEKKDCFYWSKQDWLIGK